MDRDDAREGIEEWLGKMNTRVGVPLEYMDELSDEQLLRRVKHIRDAGDNLDRYADKLDEEDDGS